ncbi:MAG: hypothetical protein ACO1RA_07600 [Planctomycetaceae bacterium]
MNGLSRLWLFPWNVATPRDIAVVFVLSHFQNRVIFFNDKAICGCGMVSKAIRDSIFGVLIAAGVLLSLLAVLTALWWGVLHFGGPFSDVDVHSRTMEPCDGVIVSMANGISIEWNVDGRFSLESDDGGTIRLGTKVEDLPSNWRIREEVYNVPALGAGKKYFVCDTSRSYSEEFMVVRVNEDTGNIVSVLVFCRRKKDLRFVHLQSSRSVSVYFTKWDDLQSFFESCK